MSQTRFESWLPSSVSRPTGRTSVRIVAGARRRYTDEDVRRAVAGARSLSEALRTLGLRPAGGNHATLKRPICELCGQGEMWRGRPMALILDHVNGVPTDNRLTNLRIVCPNCAAAGDPLRTQERGGEARSVLWPLWL